MRFIETEIPGVFIIEPELREDQRGFFTRTWCRKEFGGQGLVTDWVQSNVSYNHRAGTLRGMHFQANPHEEVKLVRCTLGAAYDVAVDLRPHSPTFRKWVGVEITASNHRAVYIPHGCAHGYQTLTDGTEVSYQVSAFFNSEAGRGVRWDDPSFGIAWPACNSRIMIERDAGYPDFRA